MKSVLLGLLLAGTAHATDGPRLGLNFMRYHWDRPGDKVLSVAEINSDVSRLGADAIRQLVRADLLWRDVEPKDDQWDFSRSDEVLKAPPATPIVTLFSMQYASATPPWDRGPGAFRPVLGAAAKDYVETVVKRYADHVRYWEIGNEMDHWRAADPGDRNRPPGKRPPHQPPGGFSPEAQGRFVAEVAQLIRAHDPDAVILMPGMGGLGEYVLDEWLPGFVKGAGSDAFDVVNYHAYGPWKAVADRREQLATVLKTLGIDDKPVWLTETGSSSLVSHRVGGESVSEQSQAADVVRRVLTSWGGGDQAVFWHTYVSSPNRPRNRWRGYGLKDDQAQAKQAYRAYRLMAGHVAPHTSVKPIAGLARGQYGYEVVREDGSMRWVFWGRGRVSAPTDEPAKAYTSVIPNAEGRYAWRGVPDSFELSEVPVLLRN